MMESNATMTDQKVSNDTSDITTNKPKQDIKFKNMAEANAHCLEHFKVTYNEMVKVQAAPQNVRAAYHAFYQIMRKKGVKLDAHSERVRLMSFVDGYTFAFQQMAAVQEEEQNGKGN